MPKVPVQQQGAGGSSGGNQGGNVTNKYSLFTPVIIAPTLPDEGEAEGQAAVLTAADSTAIYFLPGNDNEMSGAQRHWVFQWQNARWVKVDEWGEGEVTQASVYPRLKQIFSASNDFALTWNDTTNTVALALAADNINKIDNAVQIADLDTNNLFSTDNEGDLTTAIASSHAVFALRGSNDTFYGVSELDNLPAGVTITELHMSRWLLDSRNQRNATSTSFTTDASSKYLSARTNGQTIYIQDVTFKSGTKVVSKISQTKQVKVVVNTNSEAIANDKQIFNVSSIERVGAPGNADDFYSISFGGAAPSVDPYAHLADHLSHQIAIADVEAFVTVTGETVGRTDKGQLGIPTQAKQTEWDTEGALARTAVQPDQLDKILRFFQLWGDSLAATNNTASFAIFAGSTRFVKGSLNPTANATEVATWTKIKTSRMGRLIPTTVNPDQNLINFASDLQPLLTGTHDVRLYGALLNGGIDRKNYVDIVGANITETNGIYDIDFDAGDATLIGSAITLDYNAFEYGQKGTQQVNVYNIRELAAYLEPWAKRSDFKEQQTSYYIFLPSTGGIANTSEGEAQFRTSANALVQPGAQSLTTTEMDSVAFMDIHQDLVVTPDLKPYSATWGGNNPAIDRSTELAKLSSETKTAYLIPGTHTVVNTVPGQFTPRPDLGHYAIKFGTGSTRPNTMTFRLPVADMSKVGNPTVGGDPNTWFELAFEVRSDRFIEIYGHAIKEAEGMLAGEQEGTSAWASLTMNANGEFGFSELTRGSEVSLSSNTTWTDVIANLNDDSTINVVALQDASGGGTASYAGRFGDVRTDMITMELPVDIRRNGNKLQAKLSVAGLQNIKIRANRVVG